MRQSSPVFLPVLINTGGGIFWHNRFHTPTNPMEISPSILTDQKGRKPLISGRRAIAF